MTIEEAIKLENRCDKIMSGYLGRPCTMSLALSGKLKIKFNNGNYITWNMDGNHIDYICYTGFYSDLEDDVNMIQACMSDNYDIFEKLIWSYGYRSALE